MITSKMMMPTTMQILIFMSFHHICLRTRLAPRLKPCADVARLSVLSWRASRRSPRCEALFRLSCIWRTVLSISYCVAKSALLACMFARCCAARSCLLLVCYPASVWCDLDTFRRYRGRRTASRYWVDSPFATRRCASRLPGRRPAHGCTGDRRAARGPLWVVVEKFWGWLRGSIGGFDEEDVVWLRSDCEGLLVMSEG